MAAPNRLPTGWPAGRPAHDRYARHMALKSTIFKAHVQIADFDHGYYADHALSLARLPR